jgi:hypothetical protein
MEWAVLIPLFCLLLLALHSFAQWFLVRQQLVMVVREGALLYSSGRIPKESVKQLMHKALLRGHPGLNIPPNQIHIEHSPDSHAEMYQLDRIAITYYPTRPILFFNVQKLEETCTIKHAPAYWTTSEIESGDIPSTIKFGPPVKW